MMLIDGPRVALAVDRMDNGRHMIRWALLSRVQGCVFRPDSFAALSLGRAENTFWFTVGGITFGFASS